MKRFATIALLSALALTASAQGGNPPPPRPGGGPRDEERARLKDDLAAIEQEIAKVEDQLAVGNLGQKEKDELLAKKAALQGKREALRGALGGHRPPGGPDGPPPDPRMREMHDRLAELEATAAKLQADKKFDEAKRTAAEADELRRQIREMEDNRAAGNPPPGGDPMGGGGPRPIRTNVTAEDREKAVAWLKENEPVRLERLTQLKADKRFDEYDRAMTQTAFEIRDLLMLQKNDPQRYERRMEQRKLDYSASEVAEKIRGAGENQDTSAEREKLAAIVGKLFDLREADRESELKRLEDELSRLKETMKKRKAAKAKIVESRVKELLGEDDEDLKWEPGGDRQGGNPPPPPMPPGPPPTPR